MRKALAGVMKQMLRKLPPLETLSTRKQMCFAYMRWKLYGKRKDQETLVEKAKEFRKEPGRRGSSRTLVEKEARKHFRAVRKHRGLEISRQAAREHAKGQRDRGEGIHSPEELELKKQRWAEVRRKQTETRNEPRSRMWVVVLPDGTELRVKNLSKWARDHGILDKGLSATANKPWERKTYKGHKARHFDEVLDAHVPWDPDYKPLNWNDDDESSGAS